MTTTLQAHNTITVEPIYDRDRPDVHFAVVERDSHGRYLHEYLDDHGEQLTVAALKLIAQVYARMFGDDYLSGGWK